MTNSKQVISLYCGAGGIDQGLKMAGIKTTIAIDIDKDSCNTMKLNHPDCEVICGSVSDYISTLPKASKVVGGPPCPQFSRCNPGRTFDMCEVSTFWNVVDTTKADIFLMENVIDMRKYLKKDHVLINCADFGIAQRRKRTFFTNIDYPKPTHSEDGKLKKWVGIKDVLDLGKNEKYIVDMKFTGRNAKELTRSVSKPCQTITIANNLRFVSKRLYSKKYTGISINTKLGRGITLQEMAILQGFKPSYKFTGSKQSIKRQIGNAVPPRVIYSIFRRLKK